MTLPAPRDAAAPFDAEARWRSPARRRLAALERVILRVEAPIARLAGRPQFNPLHHTGAITLFLLVIIAVTGVYLTMFYQFGFDDSYLAVARVEASPVGRIIRGLHRYASGLALLTALLHGWRILFMDRLGGNRRFRWATGVFMTLGIWLAGVTGYWLAADARSQAITRALVRLLGGWSAGASLLGGLTRAAGRGWVFLLLIFLVHFGVTVALGVFFWRHVRRLPRARSFPPRPWLIALGLLLLLASLLVPSGLLPKQDPALLPGRLTIDLPFLFYLPAALKWPPALFWAAILLPAGLVAALPWLVRRRGPPPVAVDPGRCTGCALCEADCPYGAVSLVATPEGAHYPRVAVIDAARCVSCGVCVGSCLPLALSLDGRAPETLWRAVLDAARSDGAPVRLVFACERHALLAPVSPLAAEAQPTRIRVIPLTCAAMANPNLIAAALEAGAAEVQFIGCPPEDCKNREGNRWQQERLGRERAPRARASVAEGPTMTDWVSPLDFAAALRTPGLQPVASSQGMTFAGRDWLTFAPAAGLLALALGLTLLLGRVPFAPYPAQLAGVEISLEHERGLPFADISGGETVVETPVRLTLSADGKPILDKVYGGPDGTVRVFEQLDLPAGQHALRLVAAMPGESQPPVVLYDAAVSLAPREVLALSFRDARVRADPRAGERLFAETTLGANTGCRICHSLRPGVKLVGPSLAGVATRAATRVPGLSAEAYLRQSILAPDAYVVEGYPAGQMLPDLGKALTPEQLDDLVAFLLTLK